MSKLTQFNNDAIQNPSEVKGGYGCAPTTSAYASASASASTSGSGYASASASASASSNGGGCYTPAPSYCAPRPTYCAPSVPTFSIPRISFGFGFGGGCW